jgi:hypothetical protein
MFLNGTAWLHGLVSAFITGAVGATGGVVIAPETFNLQEGFHKLWQLALWAGITGAFTYLKTSPLPAIRQAIEDKKAELGAILLAFGLMFSTGCASTGGKTSVDDFTPAIKTAATFGTFYALQEHPDWSDEFLDAARALKVLEHSETIDFATIMAIVMQLPVDELKSDDARLAITGATILLSSYGGRLVELDKLENVRLIATALREGIGLGMGMTTPVE